MALLLRLSVYALAGVAFLGAFSRFTHGQYTPQWYAFQQYHAKDDGSTIAIITPIIDTVVGVALLFQKTQFIAACASAVFFALGLDAQRTAGKYYVNDVLLVALAGAAIMGSRENMRQPHSKKA